MKKKNFHIVRYYRGSKCIFATNITKKQARQYSNFIDDAYMNDGGGITVWYRMNLEIQ
jgi:hypothetical protein